MSDQYYRESAARRAKLQRLLAGLVVILACAGLSVAYLFRDTCTGGFERSPSEVIQSYITAIQAGNPAQAQRCWELNAYMNLEAGCSENCVSRILGTAYDQVEILPGEATLSQDNRARVPVQVTVTCPGGGETHHGEIILDSVRSQVPWRHWKIITSSFGGTLGEPWCK